MMLFFCLLVGMLYAGSLCWVFRDARRRGHHPWMAVMFVMVVAWPLSLSVWILLRSEITLAPEGYGSAWG